ncbi:MAG: hypothetical protein NC127_06805 [Muribaculum sp.]|nr:hypothetical protein [Muribaculum sp.]
MKKTYRFLFGAMVAVALASCNSGKNEYNQTVTRDMLTVTIGNGQKAFTKNQAVYNFDMYNPSDASFAISSLNIPAASSINNVVFSNLSFNVKQGSVGDGSTVSSGYKFSLAGTSTCPALNGYSISSFDVYLGGYNYANASYSITLDNNIFIASFATVQAYFTKTSVSEQNSAGTDFVTFGSQTNQVQININADMHTADVTIYQAKFSENQTAQDIVYRNLPVDMDATRLMITSNNPVVPTKTGTSTTDNTLPDFTADSFMITLNTCYSAEGRMQFRIGDKLVNAALLEFLPASTLNP